MSHAPATSTRLGLAVLKESLTVRANPLGLLGTRPPDQLGVVNSAVDADVGGDREIIYGANCGTLLRHLTRMLPHAECPSLRAVRRVIGRARYRYSIKHSPMLTQVNRFEAAIENFSWSSSALALVRCDTAFGVNRRQRLARVLGLARIRRRGVGALFYP